MPTVNQQRYAGYAWCEDPLCAGNEQDQVDVVGTTTEYTYFDSGGDLPGIEKSFMHFSIVEETDVPCPACGKKRACGVQERPSYPTSQWAQDGLLTLLRQGKIKPVGEPLAPSAGSDDKVADLERQLAEQRLMMAEMREMLAQQAPRRGPGRPRKEQSGDIDGAD